MEGTKDRREADEIEVTPEMIAAGIREYFLWDGEKLEPSHLVIAIFRAMRVTEGLAQS